MVDSIVMVFYWVLEALTFGFVGRDNRARSSKSVLKSLLVFVVLVFLFLLIYRFVVKS